MNIISLREFLLQSKDSNNINEKIYDNKVIKKGPNFLPKNKESAIQYCEKYVDGLCVLVDTNNFIQLWEEDVRQQQKETPQNRKEETISFVRHNQASTVNYQLTPEFLTVAKKLLCEYIGPIGSVVSKQVASEHPNYSTQQYIDALARKIPFSNDATAFKEKIHDFVIHNYQR